MTINCMFSDISFITFPISSATLPETPVSISSKINVGSSAFSAISFLMESITRERSPPEIAVWMGFKGKPEFAWNKSWIFSFPNEVKFCSSVSSTSIFAFSKPNWFSNFSIFLMNPGIDFFRFSDSWLDDFSKPSAAIAIFCSVWLIINSSSAKPVCSFWSSSRISISSSTEFTLCFRNKELILLSWSDNSERASGLVSIFSASFWRSKSKSLNSTNCSSNLWFSLEYWCDREATFESLFFTSSRESSTPISSASILLKIKERFSIIVSAFSCWFRRFWTSSKSKRSKLTSSNSSNKKVL